MPIRKRLTGDKVPAAPSTEGAAPVSKNVRRIRDRQSTTLPDGDFAANTVDGFIINYPLNQTMTWMEFTLRWTTRYTSLQIPYFGATIILYPCSKQLALSNNVLVTHPQVFLADNKQRYVKLEDRKELWALQIKKFINKYAVKNKPEKSP